jgi:hypothetical protein
LHVQSGKYASQLPAQRPLELGHVGRVKDGQQQLPQPVEILDRG